MATKVDPEEAIVPINSEIHRNNYHHTVQNDNCSNQTNNGKVAEGLSNKGFSLNAETEKQGSLQDESLKYGCNSNDADYDHCDSQLQGDITFCPTKAAKDKQNLFDKSDVPDHKPTEQNTIKNNNKTTQQKEPKSPNDVITDQVDEKKPLLQPPTCSENTGERLPTCRLIITSMKHVLWIGLSALPTIIIVCMAGFGYSHLKWTRKILNNGTTTDDGGINYYFNRWTVFWFDDVMRTFLITLLNVIVACVLYNLSMRQTLYLIASVALPITLTGSFCFYCMLEWYTSDPYAVWFYYIDIVIFMMAFFLVVPLAQLLTAKQVGAKLFKVTKLYILPMFLMALGIAFVDIYFSKTYRVEKDGSLLKYSQRLIVYPVLMDSFLSLGEFFVRRLEGTTVRGEAHSLYLIQVRFGILGRYMNLTAGNLTMLTITCSLVMLKDVVLHRMGRIQCWMFYKIKELDKIRRFFKREQSSTEEFRAWYFEERFCNFRACVLNNDLLHEFTATIVTPILLVFFRPHRLLFRFDDDLFINTKSGLFEPGLFYAQFFIQIGFLFITYVFIVFIEGRFNGVHLRYAFAQRNLLQEISQIVIYLWGMLQILSAVRVIPNYFQCDTPNICSCHFNINKTEYGC